MGYGPRPGTTESVLARSLITVTYLPRQHFLLWQDIAVYYARRQVCSLVMGNDGGSIPTRRELVKEAARNPTTAELRESRLEQEEHYWTTDPITQKPLSRPIVSDGSGKLYNKDTIIEYLVEGSRKDDVESVTQGVVKSLKDVVEVKFEVESEAQSKTNGSTVTEVWKCPVTGDRLGPGSKAVYIVPCGHAFSRNAIKEVSGEKCITCDTEYASNDIIPVVPISETDIARLSLRLKTLQERGLAHSLKKVAGGGKKRKKKDETATVSSQDLHGEQKGNVSDGPPRASTPMNESTDKKGVSSINNSSTASLAAKVIEEQDRVKKRKKDNENVRSLFSSRDLSKPLGQTGDFMTRGFSMANGTKR